MLTSANTIYVINFNNIDEYIQYLEGKLQSQVVAQAKVESEAQAKAEAEAQADEDNIFDIDPEFQLVEKTVSRTFAINLLKSSTKKVVVVKFFKKNGSVRVLVGSFVKINDQGYSLMIDSEVDEYRQVDNRTIEFIIVDNTKYNVR